MIKDGKSELRLLVSRLTSVKDAVEETSVS